MGRVVAAPLHKLTGVTFDALLFWELHRAAGAGRLVRLLDIIHTYGIAPITSYRVQLVPQISIDFGLAPA